MLSVMLHQRARQTRRQATPHVYRAGRDPRRAAKKVPFRADRKVYGRPAMSPFCRLSPAAKASPEEIEEARKLLDEMKASYERLLAFEWPFSDSVVDALMGSGPLAMAIRRRGTRRGNRAALFVSIRGARYGVLVLAMLGGKPAEAIADPTSKLYADSGTPPTQAREIPPEKSRSPPSRSVERRARGAIARQAKVELQLDAEALKRSVSMSMHR